MGSDDFKDVTASTVQLEIVRVSRTGGIEARMILRDAQGGIVGGACMDISELRALIDRFAQSYRQATGMVIRF